MFSSAEKTKPVTVQRQHQTAAPTFFRKAGEQSFFGAEKQSSFFSPVIQAKLTVSSPDDPQEKEADAVADKVMRMPEPVSVQSNDEEKKLDRKEEHEEKVAAKSDAPVITMQRKCQHCEGEEKAQAKLYRMIQRSEENEEADTAVQAKQIGLYRSDIFKQSGRGPPLSSPQPSFEQGLSSSKGSGSPMSQSTQQFMGSRFNADFSGVRIHTGSYAQSLSSSINAQAFAHGNDIYFNSGKYSPDTEAGGMLLAHELTHTIQQGASTPGIKTLPRKSFAAQHITAKQNRSNTPLNTVHRNLVDGNIVSQIDLSARTGGHQLSKEAREYLEGYYNTNLEDIRIHSDSEIAALCRAAGVHAFVDKKAIAIVPSRFNMDTEQGALLLSEQVSKSLKQQGIRTVTNDGNATGEASSLLSQIKEAVKENKVEQNTTSAENKIPAQPLAGKPKDIKPAEKKTAANNIKQSKGAKKKGSKKKGTGDGPVFKAIKTRKGRSPATPAEDPAFLKVVKKTKTTSKNQKQHEPAENKSSDAQNSAEAVPKEADGKAQNRKTDSMGTAALEDKPFDAVSFKAELLKKIEEITPKNLKEASDFKKNNKINAVKAAVNEKVESGKQTTTGPVDKATDQPLQVNPADNKQSVPLPPTVAGSKPSGPVAKDAVPKAKTGSEISMQEQSQSLDDEMKANNITDEQLVSSNEPSFAKAADEKNKAQQDAVEKPKQYQKEEKAALTAAKAEATVDASKSFAVMHGARGKNFAATVLQQQTTKQKDEETRATVTLHIEAIYTKSETTVKAALEEADKLSNEIFDTGAEAARQEFERYVDDKMTVYKAERYSGFWGGLRWAKDKLFGMPNAVNTFYTDGRKLYLDKMDAVITEVAEVVTKKLNEAKQAIKEGKKAIDEYIITLPKDQQSIGNEAKESIQNKFDSLEQSVNDKRDGLIEGLAKKYVDNVKKLDERIEALKEANKGLIDKAIGFLKKVWKAINDIIDLFSSILSRLVSIVSIIISNPGAFFDNVGKAFRMGFDRFTDRFYEHLEVALMDWLAVNLGLNNIVLPKKFDAMALFNLALAVMGITKEKIRERAVAIVGEEKVKKLEMAGGILYKVYDEGPGVLWDMVVEQLRDFKDLIWEQIKSYIKEKIIKEAIKFILSLLNPLGAFIKICMAIYNFFMTLLRFKDRILAFFDTVLSAIMQIASGAVEGAANAIESALAKTLTIIIAFLAALLGLNDIAAKVKSIILKIQKRVEKAIDWVIKKVWSAVGKGFDALAGLGDKGKAVVVKGVEKVKEGGKAVVGKAMGWLGFRKKFRDTSGGDHSIYFERTGAGTQLNVASFNPKTIRTLLNAVASVINLPANAIHQKPFNDAVTLNAEVDTLKSRLNNPSNTNANQDNELMNQKLTLLATKLPPFMTMVGGTQPPPLVKPSFVNGVKASSFEVAYLKSGRTSGGSGANTNSGASLAGWSRINQAGLSTGAAWVKMHLLTEQLGGSALDSNLTPARGPQTNTPAYNQVERPAIDAVSAGKTIWYKIDIGYHGSPDEDYPNQIIIEFGPYQINADSNQWEKKPRGTVIDSSPVGALFSQSPAKPDFSGAITPVNINDNLVGRVQLQNLAQGLSRPFAEFVQTVRSRARFNDPSDMENKLTVAHDQRVLKIDNFSSQLAALKAKAGDTYLIQ